MIGMLTGKLASRNDPHIILDVRGVGYKVYITPQLFPSITLGQELTVFTHTHVREDALELFGFPTAEDLRLFELLINVNGIGPKTAVGVFTVGNRSDIVGAIAQANVDFFTGVPRLGKKNAQKIIIELKNKIGGKEDLDLRDETDDMTVETLAALEGIGFSEREARMALKASEGKGTTVQEKVKLALKQLGK
jgi:Holliday junction DNA helicase RuvA